MTEKITKNIASQFLVILSANIQVFETFLSLKVVNVSTKIRIDHFYSFYQLTFATLCYLSTLRNHQKKAGYGTARTLLLIFQKSKQKQAGDGAERQL